MKYLDTKPQSLEETIVSQLRGDLHESKDMSDMCCKNCGDMFAKPKNESSCQYNAYDPKGKNWIKKEEYEKELEEKVECPECEGKGCDHCDDKGYHMKEGFIIESEEIDPQIKRLFRMGLVDKGEMAKAIRAFKNPEKSMRNPELRTVMLKVLEKLLGTIENDPVIFQKVRGSLKNVEADSVAEAVDPVNKKAVKKDFDDRKDKDIDNDGDVDDSDEYLHKRRKAISKEIKLKEINKKIKENKAKYDGRTREGKAFVERINNGRLKKEEKQEDENKMKKTMTDKPVNQIKINAGARG